PSVHVLTKAEAIEFDIRPYLALVTPENLLDWTFTREVSGRPVLDMVKIREDSGLYRIWTRQDWELWMVDTETDETRLMARGVHPLGRVPLVNLYNKRSNKRMIGLSDIQDIADINKNIHYLCSDAKEIIENTAFPMLALPYEKGIGKDKEVGPKNILQFDPEAPNARPYWLEAPHSSLTEIREWVRQDIEEIHRIAKMGGVKATEDFSIARSAAAMELEYQQLHSVLSEKADNLEQAETEILSLWSAWEGRAFDGLIDYPDDFSIRDLERDLEKALSAQSANVMSDTFKRELQKKIVELVFPKLDKDTKAMIAREIEGNTTDGEQV
ncbi:MAG: phage portal protein, partial [Deltaproteobacteria bacterium]|nr:phage portal protein [Deltaproteobacteria bacterium]